MHLKKSVVTEQYFKMPNIPILALVLIFQLSSVLLDTVTGQAVLSVGDLEVDHIRHLALGPIAHLLELDLLLLLPTWQVTGHG